jgi:iron complex transport system ATP-binding protein
VITFEDVTVQYGDTMALSGVSGQVHDGEWVGIIGPNGAGKTTLLRAIVRLVHHGGSARLGQVSTDGMSRRDLARMIAYVPQKPELPAEMSVADYILLGRSPHIGYFGFEKAKDHRICASLLERLDLSHMAGRTLSTLSGGELQRLVLGRALAQEAPVLLLDEPTSALDLGRRVDALEIVDTLRREHNLTVFSAMHDLTLAGQFSDRLLLMAKGKVTAAGTPAEVLDETVLGELFGHRVQVLRSSDGELVVAPRRTRAGHTGESA